MLLIKSELCTFHCRLSELGKHVGWHCLEVIFLRDRGYKRETKLLNILLFIKGNLWKVLDLLTIVIYICI